MPKGRHADEKKNHLEFSVSSKGYTLLVNWLLTGSLVSLFLHEAALISTSRLPSIFL
jgi:hypothetical protein